MIRVMCPRCGVFQWLENSEVCTPCPACSSKQSEDEIIRDVAKEIKGVVDNVTVHSRSFSAAEVAKLYMSTKQQAAPSRKLTVDQALERARCVGVEGDLRVVATGMHNAASVLADEIERLQKRVERYEAALKQYADENNWSRGMCSRGMSVTEDGLYSVWLGGRRGRTLAEEALKDA